MELQKSCSHRHLSLALMLIRIALGGLFLYAGIMKLCNMEMTIGFFATVGLPVWVTWLVAIVETLAGAMIVLGILARWASFSVLVILICAIFIARLGSGFNGMQGDLVLVVLSLVLILLGSGRWSLFRHRHCEGTCADCESGKCCTK